MLVVINAKIEYFKLLNKFFEINKDHFRLIEITKDIFK